MIKRVFSIFVVFSIVLVGTIGRLGYIMFSDKFTVSSNYNSYTLNIDKKLLTLYDKNMKQISNLETKYVSIIRPTEKCLIELPKIFDKKEIETIQKELSKGFPIKKQIDSYYPCNHIQIFKQYDNKKCFQNILYKSLIKNLNYDVGELNINFSVDAKGRLLNGDKGTVISNNYDSKEGLVLTIDKDIQDIVEKATKEMKIGSVVVLDVNNNNVLASVSKPNDNINRSISKYAVGSIFKLVVSACAIENGINETFTCDGSFSVGDTTFSCQKNKSHGKESLQGALANSCNCYFIQLALKLGEDKLLKTAEKFHYGDKTKLYTNWEFSNGNLPNKTVLNSKGQLALLSFGQGELTTTPLHFATTVSAIANGGYYIEPSLVKSKIDKDGNIKQIMPNEKNKIISKETSNELKEMMKYVVTNGTGRRANYKNDVAGKTSTAQSGKYENGKEILNTWFAGFYPFDNPKYSIVIITENGKSGSSDCCPIFRTIVENLDKK